MDELKEQISIEKEYIENTISVLEEALNCDDPDKLLPLAEDLPSVWEQFDIEISNFMSKKKKAHGKGTSAKKK